MTAIEIYSQLVYLQEKISFEDFQEIFKRGQKSIKDRVDKFSDDTQGHIIKEIIQDYE